LLSGALKNNISAQRSIIDQVAVSLKAAKNPRNKNDVKAWAPPALKLAKANLVQSYGSTEGNKKSGGSAMHFKEG
jgi:hypothetical protein